MPQSRKNVPAALHAEISEYAALLRALRTQDTLDLTSHLVSPLDYQHDSGPVSVLGHNNNEPPPTTTITHPDSKRKGIAKDHWTRWPLLAGDVYSPEWTLEDEVKSIALNYFKYKKPPSTPKADNDPLDSSDNLEDEETFLPPFALKNLTLLSSDFLSRILALLAAHTPRVAKSMQNRLKPYGWKNVLAISATSNLVSTEVLEHVREQLESIYGSGADTFNVMPRRKFRTDASHNLSQLCSSAEFSLFNMNTPIHQPKKRKRGKYSMTGKHKKRKQETASQLPHDKDTP